MPLHNPGPEDQRKIHAEITQIVNQRLQLTMFAITTFGVIAAWVIARNPPPNDCDLGAFTLVATILLFTLLFALYFYSHILKGMLRVFTTYLSVTKASAWELDWEKYRAGGYTGYTKTQTAIFMLLIALSTAMPWVLGIIYHLRRRPTLLFVATNVTGGVCCAAVYVLGRFTFFDRERGARRRWERLNKPIALIVGLGAYFHKLQTSIERYLVVEELIDEKPLSRLHLSPTQSAKFRQAAFGWCELRIPASVECVLLISQPGVHVQQLEQLADAAIPVFVEKPLGTSANEIPRLKRVAAKNPRLYCSDHYVDVNAAPLLCWLFPERQRSFQSEISVVRGDPELWRSGPARFGELQRIEATILETSGVEDRPWLASYLEGGVVFDLMYHCFTLCANVVTADLVIDKVVLRSTLGSGDLITWKPEQGGETYAQMDGHLGSVGLHCETGKYWPDEIRRFVLHYSSGTAAMVFGSQNTLRIRFQDSECTVALNGSAHEMVVARFVDYLRTPMKEPHGFAAGLWATEACDRVRKSVSG